MKILPRTQFGNPILREEAKKIPKSRLKDAEFQELIKQMFFTMRRYGVGLAAPQIGLSIKLAVVGLKDDPIRPDVKLIPPAVLINPEIIETSEEMEEDWEGCLSFPQVWGLVPRHKKVKAQYVDEEGTTHTVEVEGFHARVFQHEIDHLNGVLYIDRMKDLKTFVTNQEFRQRI